MNHIILFLHLQMIHNFRICIHTKILHSISLICFLLSRVLDKSNKKDYLKGSFRRKYVQEILLKILDFRLIGVLNGDTVLYSNYDMLRETLEYDFEQEKKTDYSVLNADMAVKQICKFVSGIWQIHPFREGNTRTTAVFTMKYLQTFGFTVNNDVFKDNSWYFRNALVRANYKNLLKDIHSTYDYLELFFRNLILGEKNVLSNRSMLIGESQSANNEISKCQNGSLDCSLDELAVLRFLKENPDARQTDIAKHIGKS